jgi:hypothetical protein
MQPVNDIALKEWAVICRELGEGRQFIVLRKGGIREPGSGFSVEHNEFFLFPTYVHQNGDELIDAARATLPDVERTAPPAGLLHLDLYAQVAAVIEVTDLEALRRLDGQHALAWSAVEWRFNYRRQGLHVMALRIFRLAEPVRLTNLARYDGCRSWVALESAYPIAGCQPVLPETEFQRRFLALQASLGCSLPIRQ